MPVLKGVALKTMRKFHSESSLVQSILPGSQRRSAPPQAPLLPDQPQAPRIRHKHTSKFHRAWRYLDDHFIKIYLIRKEALDERKRLEGAQHAFAIDREVQTDILP